MAEHTLYDSKGVILDLYPSVVAVTKRLKELAGSGGEVIMKKYQILSYSKPYVYGENNAVNLVAYAEMS